MELEVELIKKRDLQSLILNFIENDNNKEDFQSLVDFINKNNISKNKFDLQDLMQMILIISQNHHRGTNFFNKLSQIIKYVFPDIRNFFTNFEIYQIFQCNHKFILYLIHNNIITLNQEIIDNILRFFSLESYQPYKNLYIYLYAKSSNDYSLQKEIEKAIQQKFEMSIEKFQLNCEEGENESYICNLIRKDLLYDFINYVNQNNINLSSNIEKSLFETNEFLNEEKTTNLTGYAAFCGSFKIFKYLLINKAKVPDNLMLYAIHSQNSEIFQIVEAINSKCQEKVQIMQDEQSKSLLLKKLKTLNLINALKESIKCHHNDLVKYFIQKNLNDESNYLKEILSTSLKYFNYEFVQKDFHMYNNDSYFYWITMNDKFFNTFINLTKITIPSTESSICNSLFIGFKFKEIILPESITSIGKNAFSQCSLLTKISIPSTVKTIKEGVFLGCSSLSEVELSSSLVDIQSCAFNGCKSLKKILIPQSVILIGDSAFKDCSSLEMVIFENTSSNNKTTIENTSSNNETTIENTSSNNETTIENTSSNDKTKIEKTLPNNETTIENTSSDNETKIGSNCFKGCTSLKKITIPSRVTLIGDSAFEHCSSLENLTFENSSSDYKITIESNCFSGCTSLKKITIPSSIISLHKGTFNRCDSLEQVEIPSSLSKIDDYCFKGCSSLHQITFPSSMTYIGVGAFESCSSLSQIEIPSSLNEIKCFAFSGCSSLKQVLIHSNLESISSSLFKGCSSLVEFTVPSSVKCIKTDAFKGCSLLKELKITSSIMSLDDGCFDGCLLLQQIQIPISQTIIGIYTFKNCSSITEITIPSSITSIEDSAFKGCSLLKQITINSTSMSFIGQSAFKNCSLLTQIKIPSSVTKIGKNCFEGCTSLKQINLPPSLTKIKENLFKSCTSIEQIEIPSLVTSIKYCAFEDCKSLVEIKIPSSVTEIEDSVFRGCKSLIKVTMPNSLTYISDFLFYNCSSLKNIEIPSSVTKICDFSFYGCSSLEKITIPSSLTKIGLFAFNGCLQLSKTILPFGVSTNKIDLDPKKSLNNNKESFQEYFRNAKEIYQNVLNYLDSPFDDDEDLSQLIQLFNDKNISGDKSNLIELLNLLARISLNHRPNECFFNKIEKILIIYKEEIREKISSFKICEMFKFKRRIILFLFKKKILKEKDEIIERAIDEGKIGFDFYYLPLSQTTILKNSLPQNSITQSKKELKMKLKICENENEICKIIRNDSLYEFQKYEIDIKQTKGKFDLSVPKSPYETNIKLINISLLEYATYFDSYKIFNYLIKGDLLNDKIEQLLKYAVYGNAHNIINKLERISYIKSPDFNSKIHKKCFNKAIKCHHNSIARYFRNKKDFETDYLKALKYSNLAFIDDFYSKFADGSNDESLLLYLVMYEYPKFVQFLIERNNNLSFSSEVIKTAIKSDNEIVYYLIKNNKMPNNAVNLLVLVKSIINNDIKLIESILCQSNIDINGSMKRSFLSMFEKSQNKNLSISKDEDIIPLFQAISSKNIKIVKLLLKYPLIDVNQFYFEKQKVKWTPLHLAIDNENIPIIKLLINKPEIDINLIGNFYNSLRFCCWGIISNFILYFTPLHEAVEFKNIEIVKMILKHPNVLVNKIEIIDFYERKNCVRRVKQTVLCRAIQMNNLELVKVLLEHPKIDVNKPAVLIPKTINVEYNEDTESDDGNIDVIRIKPLEFAYATKNEKIIQLLLSRDDIINVDVEKEVLFDPIGEFTKYIRK